jgi:filamentous hemagglutinin
MRRLPMGSPGLFPGRAARESHHGSEGSPSVIIVEFLGFGGGDGSTPDEEGDHARRERQGQNEPHCNPDSRLQLIGLGELTAEQKQQLSEAERRNLFGN